MKTFERVNLETLKNKLMTVKHYRFCEVEYTTPLEGSMVKKDRVTKLPNPLLEGFIHKIVNVKSLATTKEGMSGYEMRATNNGKGEEFQPFQETYFTLISPCVAKHKRYDQYYFYYEVKIEEEGGVPTNVGTKLSEILLKGKKYLGIVGDVWNIKKPNKRGVDMRLVKLQNIDRISIEGMKLELIK
jgi:hypothetical protein